MSGRHVRYPVVLERARSNWSAYVPDLPVCVATGRTRAAIKRKIREAISFHIECLQESGLPIPEPGNSTIMVEVQAPAGDGALTRPRQYLVVVEPEDGEWFAYVPDIRGCETRGDTRSAVEQESGRALRACLALMGERGEPVPEPGRRTALIEVELPTERPVPEPVNQEAR